MTSERDEAHARYPGVRKDILESIDRYVDHGIEPGGFLQAVLANDLMNAMGRADFGNRHALFEITGYVYNEIPSTCHGSREIVRLWIDTKAKERAADAAAKLTKAEAGS